MHRQPDGMDERQVLRALEMIARVRPSDQSTQKAMAAVRSRLLQGQLPSRPMVYRLVAHPAFKVALAACLIVAVGLVLFLRGNLSPIGSERPSGTGIVLAPGTVLPERLADQVQQMYRSGDVDGLARLVEADLPIEVRLDAARHLAQLAPAVAQTVLSRLAGTAGPVPDAFTELLAQVKAKPTPLATAQDQGAQASATGPILVAMVIDASSGRPVPGLDVVLEGPEVVKARTGPDGLFSLASVKAPGEYRIHISSDRYLDLDQDDPSAIVSLGGEGPVRRDIFVEPGFVVDAEVVDQGSRPIPDARLVVSWLGQVQANDVASAWTDQSGTARIGPLRQQAVAYQVAAIHDAYAPQRALVECTDCNQPQQVRIVLDKGVSVTGHARYEDGAAAEGLLVYALPQWWHSTTLPSPCTTGPDGLFTLGQLQTGLTIIKAGIVQPDGKVSTMTVGQIGLPSEDLTPLTVTIPGRSVLERATLCGTIRWSGGRAADYVDLLAYSVPGTIMRQRLQGQTALFTLTGLVPGSYTLVFEGPNVAERVIGPISVPGPDLQVALSYVPTPRLQGMVVDASLGRPVAQFKVALTKQRQWPGLVYRVVEQQWHLVRNFDGRFDIPTEGPGIYRVQVEADGFVPAVLDGVDTDRDTGVVIQLKRGGTIKGKVLSSDGQPISGASVVAILGQHLDADGKGVTAYRKDYVARSIDGQFILENIPAGIHSLQVKHPGFATTMVEGIEVMEGRQTDWVTVVLGDGGSVEGVAYDVEGRPQPNLSIRFTDAETSYQPGQEDAAILAVARTDQGGRYRVDHMPGMGCWVQWQDASGLTQRMIRPIPQKVINLDLGVGASIKGTLVMDGQRDAGRAVLLADVAGPSRGLFIQRTTCSQDGVFRFYGVPAGRYGLYAQGTTEPGRWIKLAELQVQDRDLDLGQIPGQMASVAVRLVGGPGRRDWRVQIRQGDVPWGQQCGQLDPSEQEPGLYMIQYLLPGPHTVVAEDPASGWFVTRSFQIEDRAEVQQVSLEVPVGRCSMSGMVIGQIGRPLYLHNLEAGLWVRIEAKEGYYRITGLPAGHYTIGNLYLQDLLPLASFELSDGQHKILDLNPLRWSGADHGLLSVQLFSPDGLPLKDASVWLEGRSGRIEPVLRTDIENVFIAPAGRYQLFASGKGLVTRQKQVVITANDLLAVVPVRPVVQLILESERNPSNEP